MSLFDTVELEPLRFQLTDKTPGSDVRMIIQANSEENKETWVKQIRSILDMQGDFLRGLLHWFILVGSCGNVDLFIPLCL
jgi:hypothetical protein